MGACLNLTRIAAHFQNSHAVLTSATHDRALLETADKIAGITIAALRAGQKLLLAGNGGSAADAQHLAAEFVGRYKIERPSFAAIALTTDTSALTAIGNDCSFAQVFARQLQGLSGRGDVFWGFSTSGSSRNVIAALQTARERGLATVGFTGVKGRSMAEYCDLLLVAPSEDTPVIQQIHMVAGHAICDAVEFALAKPAPSVADSRGG
jgi:D-sedoheptulose 7-phosphate isomerase